MTVKQIITFSYILGRLEGLAEGLEDKQKDYLLDTCEMLTDFSDGLLDEDGK